jgi:hypothetical protein
MPGHLSEQQSELAETSPPVRQFADMLTHRQGTKFPGWADQAEASDVQEIQGFAASLCKDWPAVTADPPCPGAGRRSRELSQESVIHQGDQDTGRLLRPSHTTLTRTAGLCRLSAAQTELRPPHGSCRALYGQHFPVTGLPAARSPIQC